MTIHPPLIVAAAAVSNPVDGSFVFVLLVTFKVPVVLCPDTAEVVALCVVALRVTAVTDVSNVAAFCARNVPSTMTLFLR